MVELEEKWGLHQCPQDSSSGEHECLYKPSCQSSNSFWHISDWAKVVDRQPEPCRWHEYKELNTFCKYRAKAMTSCFCKSVQSSHSVSFWKNEACSCSLFHIVRQVSFTTAAAIRNWNLNGFIKVKQCLLCEHRRNCSCHEKMSTYLLYIIVT